jgi:hypothetical protein
MPWDYIRKMLGPGLHWGRTQQELASAIKRAREDGQNDAAEHIEIIWSLRNYVMCEEKEPHQNESDGAERDNGKA